MNSACQTIDAIGVGVTVTFFFLAWIFAGTTCPVVVTFWKWSHVIKLMPCPSTSPKIFWAVYIFWARPKIDLRIVPVTNLLCQTKIWFTFSKFGFCASTKSFEPALNAIELLVYPKIFTSTKHSRTCRRTRHKFWAFFPLQCQLSHFWQLFFKQKAKNHMTQQIIQESDKMSLFCSTII